MRLSIQLLTLILILNTSCMLDKADNYIEIYSNGIFAIEQQSRFNIKIQGRADRLLSKKTLDLGHIRDVLKGLPGNVNLPRDWTLLTESSEFEEDEKELLEKVLDLDFSQADISSRKDVQQVSGKGKRIVYFSPIYESTDRKSYLFYVGISTTHFFLLRYRRLQDKYELVYDGVM